MVTWLLLCLCSLRISAMANLRLDCGLGYSAVCGKLEEVVDSTKMTRVERESYTSPQVLPYDGGHRAVLS